MRFFFIIIQFVLLIDSTKQFKLRQTTISFKAIGNTIKTPLAKKICDTVKNPNKMLSWNQKFIKKIAYSLKKRSENYFDNRHNFGRNSIKYLRKEVINNFTYKLPYGISKVKQLVRTESKQNIQIRSGEYIGGKELRSLINIFSIKNLSALFVAGYFGNYLLPVNVGNFFIAEQIDNNLHGYQKINKEVISDNWKVQLKSSEDANNDIKKTKYIDEETKFLEEEKTANEIVSQYMNKFILDTCEKNFERSQLQKESDKDKQNNNSEHTINNTEETKNLEQEKTAKDFVKKYMRLHMKDSNKKGFNTKTLYDENDKDKLNQFNEEKYTMNDTEEIKNFKRERAAEKFVEKYMQKHMITENLENREVFDNTNHKTKTNKYEESDSKFLEEEKQAQFILRQYMKEYLRANIEKNCDHSKLLKEKNRDKLNEYNREYREKNKEKWTEYQKVYNLKDKTESERDKVNEYYREYRLKNKGKQSAYNRIYNLRHREKWNKYHREYQKKNKEKVNERNRLYRIENKGKWDEYQRNYRLKNMEKYKEYQRKYREKLKEKRAEEKINYVTKLFTNLIK